MTMMTAMSQRGQIALPKELRTALGLEAGTQFVILSYENSILLKPIKTPDISDFNLLLKKAQRIATESGMQETDIADAIKAVREGA